jgi:hypothetical protein
MIALIEQGLDDDMIYDDSIEGHRMIALKDIG